MHYLSNLINNTYKYSSFSELYFLLFITHKESSRLGKPKSNKPKTFTSISHRWPAIIFNNY